MLVGVLIAGKCGEGNVAGVKPGDSFKLSFDVESVAPVREIKGQGIVHDGISPHRVCDDDFSLTFSSGMHAHLAPLGESEYGPNELWFSLMKERVTTDGAWIGLSPVDGSAGFPIAFHGPLPPGGKTTTYGAVVDMEFLRQTIPSLDILDSAGTYAASEAVSTTFKIWRGWSANTALTCDITELTITPKKGFD